MSSPSSSIASVVGSKIPSPNHNPHSRSGRKSSRNFRALKIRGQTVKQLPRGRQFWSTTKRNVGPVPQITLDIFGQLRPSRQNDRQSPQEAYEPFRRRFCGVGRLVPASVPPSRPRSAPIQYQCRADSSEPIVKLIVSKPACRHGLLLWSFKRGRDINRWGDDEGVLGSLLKSTTRTRTIISVVPINPYPST